MRRRSDVAAMMGFIEDDRLSHSVAAGTRTHLKLRLTSDHLAVIIGQALAPKIGLFRAAA